MNRASFLCSLAAAVGALFCLAPLNAQLDGGGRLKLPRVVISAGGPYASSGPTLQQFSDSIDLVSPYVGQPLSLVFTNGSERTVEFEWLRVFLLPGGEDANLQQGSQPVGRLLIDERSFLLTPQVYLDMTGQLNPGLNKIAIEGAGRKGATFQWELRSVGVPVLQPSRPVVLPGGSFTLYGSGFSLRADENTVRLGQGYLTVEQSNFSQMLVRVPNGWTPGVYDLSVLIDSYQSKSIKVVVAKPPQS